jgi:hypothetical protein
VRLVLGSPQRSAECQMQRLASKIARYRQIKLSVIGRKSGKTISNPVWFVLEGDKLYLLPVRGSDTQWYKERAQEPVDSY